MQEVTLIQIFLLANVFLAGILAAIAAQHAYAHFRPHEDHKKNEEVLLGGHLPPELKNKLLQEAEASFKAVLEKSAGDLQRDLAVTSAQLNKSLGKVGTETLETEMRRYRAELEHVRGEAEALLQKASTEIHEHQTHIKAQYAEQQEALKAKLAIEVAAEKDALVKQMDTKLGDAMASFLAEALGHEVDLGAQSTYLTSMLEKHKAEIIEGVVNDK